MEFCLIVSARQYTKGLNDHQATAFRKAYVQSPARRDLYDKIGKLINQMDLQSVHLSLFVV
ncbi:hypothetical protein Bca52824_047048 [Brassica carinata]|uniref:Uncharacterized protein n=1 Tax=Brassica carinata TaxID=52824 RepID=A0A8X7UQS4_BRACI|nr:hypothetical protein Bca52824_047048 [Brassica carinata]